MIFLILQISFIAAIVAPWTGRPGWTTVPAITAEALMAVSVLLFLWVLRHNPPGNFSFRPEPPPSNRLITSGPYRFIRHPMYLAVLLVLAGFALLYGELWRWLVLAALGVVLHFKAQLEERHLCSRFPEYRDYQTRTKSILPFVL